MAINEGTKATAKHAAPKGDSAKKDSASASSKESSGEGSDAKTDGESSATDTTAAANEAKAYTPEEKAAKAEKELADNTPAPKEDEQHVAQVAKEITEEAVTTQQPIAPGQTGAPVPADVHLPNFGEQGAQQHTLNAQAGNTSSTDVPAAAHAAAAPTPAPAPSGAANPDVAGPLQGARTIPGTTPPIDEPQPTTAASEEPAAPEDQAPETSPAPMPTVAAFYAEVGVEEKVVVDGPKGPQDGTTKGITFGADSKPVSYSVEITDKPFNPMDPAHHGKSGRPTENFPAAMVRKA